MHVLQSFGVGGKERIVVELANRLPRDEFVVEIVSRIGGPNLRLVDRSRVKVCVLTDEGWHYHAALPALWSRMVRGQFDIVHGHPGTVCRIASIGAGVPIRVTTAHTLEETSPARIGLERLLLRRTEMVVAVSHAAGRHFAARHHIGTKRIAVIHNGIDVEELARQVERGPAREELGLPSGELVGVVSRLHPDKGIEVFLGAAAAVARTQAEARFVIAGDGPEREHLERQAASLGIDERVQFLGFREDVPHLLRHLSMLVHPTRRAGFEIALVEAMAARLPVVASATGAIPEVVDEGMTGVLVPPGDSRALAQGILKLLENPRRGAAMGEAGYARARAKFDISRSVEAHRQLYWQLVARKCSALWAHRDLS